MLDAYGQRTFGLHHDVLAVHVLRLDLYLQRAGDVGVQAGKRQAALLVDLRAVLLQQLGVDQRQRLVAPLAHVGHQHPLVHVDLGGGQADAVGRVHGFEHVGHELLQLGVERGDRRGAGAQARVGELQDGKYGHRFTSASKVRAIW